jgi:hypothetical protein
MADTKCVPHVESIEITVDRRETNAFHTSNPFGVHTFTKLATPLSSHILNNNNNKMAFIREVVAYTVAIRRNPSTPVVMDLHIQSISVEIDCSTLAARHFFCYTCRGGSNTTLQDLWSDFDEERARFRSIFGDAGHEILVLNKTSGGVQTIEEARVCNEYLSCVAYIFRSTTTPWWSGYFRVIKMGQPDRPGGQYELLCHCDENNRITGIVWGDENIGKLYYSTSLKSLCDQFILKASTEHDESLKAGAMTVETLRPVVASTVDAAAYETLNEALRKRNQDVDALRQRSDALEARLIFLENRTSIYLSAVNDAVELLRPSYPSIKFEDVKWLKENPSGHLVVCGKVWVSEPDAEVIRAPSMDKVRYFTVNRSSSSYRVFDHSELFM